MLQEHGERVARSSRLAVLLTRYGLKYCADAQVPARAVKQIDAALDARAAERVNFRLPALKPTEQLARRVMMLVFSELERLERIGKLGFAGRAASFGFWYPLEQTGNYSDALHLRLEDDGRWTFPDPEVVQLVTDYACFNMVDAGDRAHPRGEAIEGYHREGTILERRVRPRDLPTLKLPQWK